MICAQLSFVLVKYPSLPQIEVPYRERSVYRHADLVFMANSVIAGGVAKTTVDYWVKTAFGTKKPRSVRLKQADIEDWAVYLRLWLSLPRSQVTNEFRHYKETR